MALWKKDPADVAVYAFDWSDWLATGETIAAATVTVEDGLTKLGDQISGSDVLFRVSGGATDPNGALVRVAVTCTITTSTGNVWETTKSINVKERVS